MDDENRETATNGKASHYLSWLDGKFKKADPRCFRQS